ncbi:caspase-3 [Anoplophora glabripennis]|uniref:Caspase-3 n=1 Tax=Anoplophora glabripennis TaxID=217634 RepID=V5GMN8_ANOGL|nr:caspase-3 [Anoplophora glabripennis]
MSLEIDANVNVSPPSQSSTPLAVNEDVFDFAGLDEVEKFVERKHFLTDTFEYPRNGSDPGFVLIFNQENFENERDRVGTRRDVNEITECLQRQGFNIGKSNIIHNASPEEIKAKLKQVSEDENLKDCNSLIIFFLTHGKEKDKLLTYNSSLTTNDIWKNFINCRYLENKPKMFVFQACKGGSFSTTRKTFITNEPSEIVPSDTFSQTYLGPDMLIVYSTIEGNVSYRNSLTGTWFIQELCKNITGYGKRDDVFSIITRTTKCVCGNYFYHESGVNKKQMPVCMSTLSKKFYLNRNKDRALVLMSRNYYDDVLKHVKEIKESVDTLLT